MINLVGKPGSRLTPSMMNLLSEISDDNVCFRPHKWLPEQGWEDVIKLAEVFPEDFGSLVDEVEKGGNKWQQVRRTTLTPFSPFIHI